MASIKAMAAIALTLMIAVPIGVGYMLAEEENTYEVWNTDQSFGISEQLTNSTTPIYMNYTGTTNNSKLANGASMVYKQTGTVPTAYPAMTATSHSITFTAHVATDLSAYSHWTITVPGYTTYSLDGVAFVTTTTNTTISGYGGSITFVSTATYTLVSYEDTGTYAYVNYGWTIPNSDLRWINEQTNRTVTMLIELPDDEYVYINGLKLNNTGGTVTAEYIPYPPEPEPRPEYTIGVYRYLLVEHHPGYDVVSGVNSWYTMGNTPTLYNTTTIEGNGGTTDFTQIRLRGSDVADTVFRVEKAEIVSGSFPATVDYTLDMNQNYPGQNYDIKLNSVGIYGDTITIGGTALTVTSGRVVVDGLTIALKGAVISSHFNGVDYTAAINGKEVARTPDPATITFGGTWSLTATASIVSQTTESRVEWAPGGFAFDREDFAACGLLVAGACMVGLGMTGQRSGMKIGLLMLVCGGASLVYLTLI